VFVSVTVTISTAAHERRAWNTCGCFTIAECRAKRWYLSGAPGQGVSALLSSVMDYCDTLCLADVNPEAVEACRRTVA
jgi:hypothetical protein